MKKTFLLIANGEVDCRQFVEIDLDSVDTIVAADGGLLKALDYGIVPNVIIGDMDSIKPEQRREFPKSRFIYQPSQELNDLEKALIFCREQKAQRLIVVGVSGERLDHSFNNLSVLARYDKIFDIEIYDRYSRIFLVRSQFEYSGKTGQVISLIPMGKVEGITTAGLKYSLKNETLKFGAREGLSNVIIKNPVSIKIRSGLLLVFANRINSND